MLVAPAGDLTRHGYRATLVGMSDDPEVRPPRRSRGAWRVGTPLVVLLCGALFVVSAENSEGTDLRPGRYTDLASLVSAEAERYDELEQRVAELNGQVEALSSSVGDRSVGRVQQRIEQLRDPAGLTPREGPGVTVTLADSPPDIDPQPGMNPNLLIVHQQDIQAVVNAMWKAGAEAVTVAGQRIVSTTGIRCEGNAVTLQGVPYPQPYVISAVGDPERIAGAIATDDYLRLYQKQADDPDIQIGWDVEVSDELVAPAYQGLLDLSYAEPLA